jgi:hypothetical protein
MLSTFTHNVILFIARAQQIKMEAMITFNKDDGFTEAVVRGFKTQGIGE